MSESFNLGNLMDDLSTYAETATDEELLEDARQGGAAHKHHEVSETIPGPSAEPPDAPVVKTRANRYWGFQPQELRFKAHTV